MLTSPRAFLTPLQPPFIVALVTSSNIKNWDYDKRTLDFSLPSYVAKALQRFNHPIPARPQHAPHECVPPQYGAKTQPTASIDTSPRLGASGISPLQDIIGVFVFYARAVDLRIWR
jgi:hypothetical protein